MFRAPLCPSSGAREYYTGGCCLWYLVLWFSSCRYGVELRIMCPVCGPQTGYITIGSNHLYITLELLIMGIMVPETCWESNKICNKNRLLHLVGILFPHIKDDARSKPHRTQVSRRGLEGRYFMSPPTLPSTAEVVKICQQKSVFVLPIVFLCLSAEEYSKRNDKDVKISKWQMFVL